MASAPPLPQPRRGEIWFVKFPSDPPDKNPRPVVIVSGDARNLHPRAETVLVVPLSTTLRDSPTHIRLQSGESGLAEACDIQAENISTIRKQSLQASRTALRSLTELKLRQIARCVIIALGFAPGGVL
jgi:mRNA-degrading endonuclease toxin of MazEF toxin-antitoxin module